MSTEDREKRDDDATVPSFRESLKELEDILHRIEAEDVDIDRLAEELARAAELLEVCRSKIRRTELEVSQIVDKLEDGSTGDSG